MNLRRHIPDSLVAVSCALAVLTSTESQASDPLPPVLNLGIFGKPATAPLEVLQGGEGFDLPVYVSTDVKDGKYVAANVFYPVPIRLDAVRRALNLLHPETPPPKGSTWRAPRWRFDDRRLVIVLSESHLGVVAYYLPYTDGGDVMLHALAADAYGDDSPEAKARGLIAVATARFEREEFPAAIRSIEDAAFADADQTHSFVVQSILGRSHVAIDRYEEAVPILRNALHLHGEPGGNPGQMYRDTVSALSRALERIGAKDEARQLRKKLEKLPQASGPGASCRDGRQMELALNKRLQTAARKTECVSR